MAVIGIVCEYNPFHRGHELHIQKSRAALGEESTVVCVQSGDFVQRGEAAVYDKFARAEAACRCGADLVAELPLPWCLASAEGFARGAVSLLSALGATHLSFGSETGELRPLQELAEKLAEPGLIAQVKTILEQDPSLSFAAAREEAARRSLGESALLLRQPNNILAVEYLKAIGELRLPITPLPILRQGAPHDGERVGQEPCSASQLRGMLRAGESIAAEVPQAAAEVYSRERAQGRELSDPRLMETALLSRLQMLGEADFARLPDASGGLGQRLYKAVQQEASLEGILTAAKSKRYALARLRRMCLCAALGLRAETGRGVPPYARVLAANARGRALLRKLDGQCCVPLLTKPGAVRELGADCEGLFRLGARAHDFFTLSLPPESRPAPGEDWRRGPWIGG